MRYCTFSLPEPNPYHQGSDLLAAARNLGKDPTHITKYKELLAEEGFVNVVERKYAVPVNTWAPGKQSKTMGGMLKLNLLAVVSPISVALFPRGLGVSTYGVVVPPIPCALLSLW